MSTKDGSTHRKRNKSESDSAKHLEHKEEHRHKAGRKGGGDNQHSKPDNSHPHPHKGDHHKGDHHHKGEGQHHKGEGHHVRKISRDHHGDHQMSGHHKGEGQHHKGDGHHVRKISRDHHGDHQMSASHHFRPRANTLSRRDTGHSTHHESDRRSTGTADFQPLIELENTYKLVPDARFEEGQVKKIIQDVLKENITEKTYDAAHCGQKCMLLSEIIKERVKHLNMTRFKIISIVMIGQESEQAMLISSRCLWDQRFDNFVSSELKRGNIFALGLVYAVYAE